MAEGLLDQPLAKKLLQVALKADLDLETALHGGAAGLQATEIAQPALFLVETVLAAQLPKKFELLGTAGHSVGEYAAVVASGAMDATDAMQLVIERGQRMAGMRRGTMAAVLGADLTVVEEICRGLSTDENNVVVVANINAPGQVVISGTPESVAAAGEMAKQSGAKRVVPLNVSGAFHSPLMAAAARDFVAAINAVEIRDTKIPVVGNADGQSEMRAEDIRHGLRRQMVSVVRWTDCVARLAGLGVDVLVEVGPQAVLTGLAKRVAPGVDAVSVTNSDEMATLPDRLGVKAR